MLTYIWEAIITYVGFNAIYQSETHSVLYNYKLRDLDRETKSIVIVESLQHYAQVYCDN